MRLPSVVPAVPEVNDGVLFMSQGMVVLRVPINGSQYDVARPINLNTRQQAVGKMPVYLQNLYFL